MESGPHLRFREQKEESVRATPETAKTPEEFLNAIDFSELNAIFDSLIRKIGPDTTRYSNEHRVEKKKITFIPKLSEEGIATFQGRCNIFTGEIEIVWDPSIYSDTGENINMLKTLIHETCHIKSGFLMITTKDEHGEVKSEFNRNGVEEYWHTPEVDHLYVGTSLNEAITENISDEVLFEYLIRTGDSESLSRPEVLAELGYGSYVPDRILLSMVIDALARVLEIPRDTMWKGIVSAYLSGSTEFYTLFRDIQEKLIGEEVYKLLPLITSEKSLKVLQLDNYIKTTGNVGDAIHAVNRIVNLFTKPYLDHALGLR